MTAVFVACLFMFALGVLFALALVRMGCQSDLVMEDCTRAQALRELLAKYE
jgi:hypothetical protein